MSSFLREVAKRQNAPEAVAHRVALFLSSRNRRAIITEAADDIYFYGALIKRVRGRHGAEFFKALGRSKVISVL